jgi:uncharacterized protein with HEPN domain
MEYRIHDDGIPWKAIKGMHNIMPHGYGDVSIEQI